MAELHESQSRLLAAVTLATMKRPRRRHATCRCGQRQPPQQGENGAPPRGSSAKSLPPASSGLQAIQLRLRRLPGARRPSSGTNSSRGTVRASSNGTRRGSALVEEGKDRRDVGASSICH
jgi:hypothetical protein